MTIPDTPLPAPHAEGDSDGVLMLRIAHGDRSAFEAIVGRHQSRVLKTAYRFLGDWALAEDAAQDVFLKLLRAARDYRPEAAFTTWLYTLVANRCWDLRRHRQRLGRLHERAFEHLARTSETEAPDADSERATAVREAIAGLPDRQRLAVVLHRFDALSHAEIAAATGWSVGAVESCLVRAYASLRKSLCHLD